mgnify:FL=1
MKEERNLGYRRISYILNEKNYRSIRSNKILKNNYIYSIYYKGKIRENRINRKFDSEISDVRLISWFFVCLDIINQNLKQWKQRTI